MECMRRQAEAPVFRLHTTQPKELYLLMKSSNPVPSPTPASATADPVLLADAVRAQARRG